MIVRDRDHLTENYDPTNFIVMSRHIVENQAEPFKIFERERAKLLFGTSRFSSKVAMFGHLERSASN